MNPLTLVKRIQQINSKEAALGISEQASWHAKYKESAYVFVGGIPFDLTEGDLLAVFAQYGEIVDVNLVRDKGTGKSKGFAFVAYEDQRSTNLAVDNLNGAQVLGRTVRVDHVTKYKKMEEEDEETQREKREARGVCRAFQKGECTRGAGCKFSHDEQRAANTGWGHQEDRSSKWGHDRFDGSKRTEKDARSSRPEGSNVGRESQNKPREEFNRRNEDSRGTTSEKRHEGRNKEVEERRRRRDDDAEPGSRKEYDDGRRREEKRSRRHESENITSRKEEPERERGRDGDRRSHLHRRDEDDPRDHRSRR